MTNANVNEMEMVVEVTLEEGKMTQRKALEFVLENCELPNDVAEKLTALKTSLDKKASKTSSGGSSKVKEENIKKAEEVVVKLKGKAPMTVTEIVKEMGWIEKVTTSKMTAILNATDKIDKKVEKGRSKYFVIG